MGLTSIQAPSVGGIYEIIEANGDRYVGSSSDMKRRWSSHLSMLRNGKHNSKTLQEAYSRDGESSIKFHVLEVVTDESKLVTREQAWFNKLEPKHNASHAGRTVRKRLSERPKVYHEAPVDMSVAEITARRMLESAEWIAHHAKARGDYGMFAASWFLSELVREHRTDYQFLSRLQDCEVFTRLRGLC